ncbi:hypothetical protein EMIT051CA3_11339 [Pseudomonas chlororaphis]
MIIFIPQFNFTHSYILINQVENSKLLRWDIDVHMTSWDKKDIFSN